MKGVDSCLLLRGEGVLETMRRDLCVGARCGDDHLRRLAFRGGGAAAHYLKYAGRINSACLDLRVRYSGSGVRDGECVHRPPHQHVPSPRPLLPSKSK